MHIRKLILMSLVILALAYITGYVLDHRYKKRWNLLFFEKIDEAISGKTNYDIVFFGDSRVHFGINPYYIDSITGMNSYNFGVGGNDITDISLLSNLYLNYHQPPKMILINVTPITLANDKFIRSRYPYLFYLKEPLVRSYLSKAGFHVWLIRLFPFLKYSFFDEYNRTSMFARENKLPVFDHNIHKGFISVHPGINTDSSISPAPVFNLQKPQQAASSRAIQLLIDLVKIYRSKGSEVVFIYPPSLDPQSYKTELHYDKMEMTIEILNKNFGSRSWKPDREFIPGRQYFMDDSHLNEPGTRLYSIDIALRIKKAIEKQNIMKN